MTDHTSNTPPESKDHWSTPQWLYDWLDSVFHFEIDLAASADNTKHKIFYSEEDDAHHQHWNDYGRKIGFLNCPYSSTPPWIQDAVDMQEVNFTTTMVLPTPNGEKQYKNVFMYCFSPLGVGNTMVVVK